MKIFVKYDQVGHILSVSKVEVMPEGMDQPYGELLQGESVMEIPAIAEFAQIDALELHRNYYMDIEKRQLLKKS